MAKRAGGREQRFWLMKSEPGELSFDALWAKPKRTVAWDGVRNYQARNFMRHDMAPGDGVLFYHSSAEPTGIAGIAEIARGAYPDPTQFERGHDHFDPRSKPEAPAWVQVDVRAVEKLARVITREELGKSPPLSKMGVLQRGNRLSIQPVTPAEWREVLRLARGGRGK
jgi:predicted RNA-binding protein with PUA-like domain